MQRNTGLKKQKMWTREWISFLLKNLLAKMPLFVILQVLTLKWIKKLLLTGVAECSALARVSILSCFLFSFPFVLLGWCLLCHFWKTLHITHTCWVCQSCIAQSHRKTGVQTSVFQFQAADPAENVTWLLMLLLAACGRPCCFGTLWQLFKRAPRRPGSLLSTTLAQGLS